MKNKDEKQVVTFLKEKGLCPESFLRSQGFGNRKTPDSKVSGPGDIFFLCEVKSVFTETGSFLLHSTKYNSIIKNAHDAVKQFDSVNETRSVPMFLFRCLIII